MAYNFKSLADVELLNAMPENANVIVEVDGATRRAPQVQPVDEIAQIVNSETLEEVPEGATVLAEVNGEIKRVPSNGLGGGKALIIKNFVEAQNITANMTFDEAVAALVNYKLVNSHVFILTDSPVGVLTAIAIIYDISTYIVPCLQIFVIAGPINGILYWTADGGISTTEPESASAPS